jgi:hypothetical protein
MKPFTLVFLSLAPFLSLADAVDGAPAVANNNNNNMMARHRRAPAIETPRSPLRRRHADSRRQVDNSTTTSDDNGELLLSLFLILCSCFSPSCFSPMHSAARPARLRFLRHSGGDHCTLRSSFILYYLWRMSILRASSPPDPRLFSDVCHRQ